MILCFELSMPNVGSWNSQWFGGKDCYAKVINFGHSKKAIKRAQRILDEGYYRYNFGDGWAAGIKVKEVDNKESARMRRKSKGFCGYDWMVDSIRLDGKIISSSERRAL